MRTRYSWSLGCDLAKNSIQCLAIANGIAKEFGGATYAYLHNCPEDPLTSVSEFFKYFFPDLIQLERRSHSPYLAEAVKLAEAGHATPHSSESKETLRLRHLSKEKQVSAIANGLSNAVVQWPIIKGWEVRPEIIDSFALDTTNTHSPVPLIYINQDKIIPALAFANAVDDAEHKIQFVIREKSLAYMTIQECIIHYLRGTSSPIYFHIDQNEWNDVDVTDYKKNNMPGPLLANFLYGSYKTNKPAKFNDFGFLKRTPSVLKREHVANYIGRVFIDLGHTDKSNILKAAMPDTTSTERDAIICAVKQARSRTIDEINNIGNIIRGRVIYGSIPIPNMVELNKFYEFLSTTDSKDFENQTGFGHALSTFSIAEGFPVATLDSMGEIVFFGNYVMTRLKWFEVARLMGCETSINVCKKAIEVFSQRRKIQNNL